MKNTMDTTLLILKILMEATSKERPITKVEILDILANKYFKIIETKQFYNCYDRLIESGFPVVKVKGRRAVYYYDSAMLRESDIIYLLSLIDNDNISINDKERLRKALVYNPFNNEYYNSIFNGSVCSSNIIDSSDTTINYSVLDNLNSIYEAKRNNLKISYKIYRDNTISELMEGSITLISKLDKRIIVTIENESYFINEIINVNILNND